MEQATVKRVLDKRYKKKLSKTYHLALRVTYKRTPIIFPIDHEVTEEDFRKLASPRLGDSLAAVKAAWIEAERRAEEIIKGMGTFTVLAFQEAFYKDHSRAPHESLTPREFVVFQLVSSGKSVSSIAKQLSLAVSTISTYKTKILAKMKVKSSADLTRYALENKLM